MVSEKLKDNQRKTATLLKEKAKAVQHQQVLDSLALTRSQQKTLLEGFANFLNNRVSKTEITNQLTEISTPDVANVVSAIEAFANEMRDKAIDFTPVTLVMEQMIEQLAAIPKESPEAAELIVDFTDTNSFLERIEAAIRESLTVEVKPADVHVKVPKPSVIVQEADLSTLEKSLEDILGAFQAFQIPEVQYTDLTTVEALLETANDLLEKIEGKNFGGGGGGGGGMVPYKSPSTGLSVQVTLTEAGEIPISSKPTDRYNIVAISETATYKYFWFEAPNLDYYIMRKTLATSIFDYTKGTEGYEAVYVNSISGPSGTPVFGTYGETF